MWTTIIDKTNNQKYIDKLLDIYRVSKNELNNSSWDLMNGRLGHILFLSYYSMSMKDEECKNIAISLLYESIDNLEKLNKDKSLSSGISGFGWLIHHLINIRFIDYEDSDFDVIDDIVIKSMKSKLLKNRYDLLTGPIGQALYILERKTFNNKNYELNFFIEHINKIKIKNDESVYWNNYEFAKTDSEYDVNLGLAHGVVSIGHILSKLHQIGYLRSKSQNLINGIVRFYKNNMMSGCKNGAIFPDTIKTGKFDCSRLGWCYGDLGIGIALLNIGNNINDLEIKSFAIDILLQTVKRRDLKSNSIYDSSLCHGTSGIAHIYSKAFNLTNNEIFRESANFWFSKTIEMASFKDGPAGYKTWYKGWNNDYGLLTGISGIGLSIISGVFDIEPEWNKIFLLN